MTQELTDWHRQLAAGIADATPLEKIDRGPVTQGAELTDESAWDAFALQRGGAGKGERLARLNDAHATDLQVQFQGYLGELPR